MKHTFQSISYRALRLNKTYSHNADRYTADQKE